MKKINKVKEKAISVNKQLLNLEVNRAFINQCTLRSYMGHSAPNQTMAYGKISDQRKREAGNKIQLDLRNDLPDLMNFLSGPDIATLRRYMGHLNP